MSLLLASVTIAMLVVALPAARALRRSRRREQTRQALKRLRELPV